ncbi:hypothetical protein [Streptomyces fagopyri]|uniref:hypothetical protein n=1 Tax=Streptomyces fagopyri TaxID=2662397 RepID=UPI003722A8C4
MAKPRPRLPPVTKAVRPSKFQPAAMFGSSSQRFIDYCREWIRSTEAPASVVNAGFTRGLPSRLAPCRQLTVRGAHWRTQPAPRVKEGWAMEVLSLEAPHGRRGAGSRRASGAGPRAKVAIGTFDGVHLGHHQVLRGCDTALTFDPHPMRVLEPRHTPALLSDRRRKLQKLGALGIRRVAIVAFDRTWSRVPAEDFIESVLVDRLGAEFVSVGQGFRFGARGAGTTATFARYPELSTRVVPLVTRGPTGEPISSTRIRRLVADGDVELAADLLGASFTLPAVVGDEGRLLISSTFARPAPGFYLGYVDSHPCALRVCQDRTVAVTSTARTGTHVDVTFVRRAP